MLYADQEVKQKFAAFQADQGPRGRGHGAGLLRERGVLQRPRR